MLRHTPHRLRVDLLALLPLVLLTAACATHAGRGGARGPTGAGSASRRDVDPASLQTGRVGRRDHYIDAEELQEVAPRVPLDEAVPMLRPNFLLRERGGPLVYVDGIHVGGLAALRTVPPHWVRRIELLDRAEAAQRHARARDDVVIEVTLRPRSERGRAP